jgi:hypothetical protein
MPLPAARSLRGHDKDSLSSVPTEPGEKRPEKERIEAAIEALPHCQDKVPS